MDEVVHGAVLVVDDNAENRALAKATLEDEGYPVVLAASGPDALACFEAARPDCVVLDVRMPGMDGIAVCRRLRALPGGADVPVLFVTAQRDVDTFDRAREAGGDDFLSKPYRPSELIARVAAATKLRRLHAERSELYDVIRRQRDDVMRLQLHKEQLIAFLVHDLKNPVHAIDLHGQRILRDAAASARAKDAATKIQAESRALLRMIMNLLDLSKADEGQLTPALVPVPLPPLCAELAELMQPRAQAAQVTLQLGAGCAQAAPAVTPTVLGDRELIRRILENLVDNAIRHAPEDSTVTLSATSTPAGVELRVADAGPGVPADQRAQIFDRYVQTGSSTGRTNRGLGLAFCKLAVEAQAGELWIEDAAPGAVFCVRFRDVV